MAPVINKKDMVEESEAVEEKEDHVVSRKNKKAPSICMTKAMNRPLAAL